ncbi:hypothetical protein AB0C96_33295 [Streptomyces sp. NPDC048506]|uniref:hypothetical protein n=1 Tax=Streptomyces sp. NPDC048506 TaxID=3155028 RepID=UPI00342009CA
MSGLLSLLSLPNATGSVAVTLAAIGAIRVAARPLATALCLCVLALSRDPARRSDVLRYVALLKDEPGRRRPRRRRRRGVRGRESE